MEYPIQLTEFDQLMAPTETMISLIYVRELKYKLLEFFTKYGENSLNHKGALEELEGVIKEFTMKGLSLLSKEYRKKLKVIFTTDGIIYYIYSRFYDLIVADLENKIDSLPRT